MYQSRRSSARTTITAEDLDINSIAAEYLCSSNKKICKVLESFYKLLLQDVLPSVNVTGVAILVIFFCFTRIWCLVKLRIEELFKIIYELNCI